MAFKRLDNFRLRRLLMPVMALPTVLLAASPAIFCWVAATTVVGQDVEVRPVPVTPVPATPAADGAELYKGPGPRVAPIREVDPDDPYREAAEPQEQPAPLMEEGRRLIERTGRLVRRADGSYFVFDGSNLELRLLPNHFMQRIEDVSDFGSRAMQFRITTTVQKYRDRNCLLLTRAPEVVRSGAAASGVGGEDGGEAVSPSGEQGGSSAAGAGELENAAGAADDGDEPDERQRDIPPESGDLSVPALPELPGGAVRSAPPDESGTEDDAKPVEDSRSVIGALSMRRSATGEALLIPDGRLLVDREGRIDRVGDETRFVFDSGDEPMTLLPNAKLERIEDASDYGRRGQRFRVSGEITAYRGRNFLILSKVLIIPKAIEDL